MSVTLELIQNGNVLKSYQHEGKNFVEAPPTGAYTIRLTNRTSGKKLCVLSVDGRNICDGTVADFSGPGYVINSFQTVDIPGWRRTNREVAEFEFKPQEQSYAAKIGDGTSNTGVIGLAVFREKEPIPLYFGAPEGGPYTRTPVTPWYQPESTSTKAPIRTKSSGGTLECFGPTSEDPICEAMPAAGCAAAAAPCESDDYGPERGGTLLSERSRLGASRSSPFLRAAPDLGTGYGTKKTMYTSETTFERASPEPSYVYQVQYAVRERLIEWGVPVSKHPPSPNAFPKSQPIGVRPPDGWRG